MAKSAHLSAAAKKARVVPAAVSRVKSAAVIDKASRQVRAKAAVAASGTRNSGKSG
jgi:hypothetical protein